VYGRGWLQSENSENLGIYGREPNDYKCLKVWPANTTTDLNSYPDPGVEFQGYYLFCAFAGSSGSAPGGELFYTDGETVNLQYNFVSGNGSNWVKELTVAGGSVYWFTEDNSDVTRAAKLHRLDSIKGGTGNGQPGRPVRVYSWNSSGSDNVQTLRSLGDSLLLFTRHTNGAAGEALLYSYYYRQAGFDPATHSDPNRDKRLDFGDCPSEDGDCSCWPNCPSEGVDVEQILGKKAVIYPNPATNTFNINIEGEVLNVMIFDVMGRLVKTELHAASKSVDVSSLSKGIYNVLIRSAHQNYQSILIVE
jgi:hypothetical protein